MHLGLLGVDPEVAGGPRVGAETRQDPPDGDGSPAEQ